MIFIATVTMIPLTTSWRLARLIAVWGNTSKQINSIYVIDTR